MDERLREAHRKWQESGSIEDEAAFLEELKRVGATSRDRLRVASGLGSKAAATLLGDETPVEVWELPREAAAGLHGLRFLPEEERDQRWVEEHRGLKKFQREVSVRVSLAAARCVLSAPGLDEKRRARVMLAIRATEAWLGPQTRKAAADAARQAWEAEIVANEVEGSGQAIAWIAALAARTCSPDCEGKVREAVERALEVVEPATLLEAIRSDLLPWALGHEFVQ